MNNNFDKHAILGLVGLISLVCLVGAFAVRQGRIEARRLALSAAEVGFHYGKTGGTLQTLTNHLNSVIP